MTTKLPKLLDHWRQMGDGPTDGQLLARFVAGRDEASFAALVQRHGPMVFGVCRRVLRHVHDAEDAFQATFLVLARKAASVVRRDSVGSWLYAVAYHTALEAARANTRRRARERQVGDMPQPEGTTVETPDWLPLLDQELNRLSEKYRAAVVLCDLEGRPRKEAARLLAVPEGTLSSRLAKARQLLARRLSARGVTAGLVGGAALAPVPAALAGATVRAATLVAAGQLAAATPAVILMKGVMKAMFLKKLRLVVGAVMVVAALGAVGLASRSGGEAAAQPAGGGGTPAETKGPSELEALRKKNKELQRNVDILLDRVLAQDAELEALKAHKGPGGTTGGGPKGGMSGSSAGTGYPPSTLLPSDGNPGEGPPRTPPGGTRPGGGLPGAPGAASGIPPQIPGLPGSLPGSGGIGGATPGSNRVPDGNDATQEVEAALRALREAPDKDGQQRAVDTLEKAMKKLRRQLDQTGSPAGGN